ncbi:hypothetical protein NKJ46_34055 [Mesorhizobium sp. M0166]|uniref:hypothetical protein n=1 Tax=unclassified Mesorhizobium TaxID=325217 RepID=UPI0033384AE3
MSMLPQLEPVLGAALGLNLAYLNLAVFAYITRISDSVSESLAAVEASATDAVKDTIWYGQLRAIADVKTIDKNRILIPETRWINTPPSVWGILFNVFFFWRLGKLLSIVLTVFVAFMLILGTAHSAGIIGWFLCKDANSISFYFLLSVLAFVWPMLMAWAGAWVQLAARRFLRYQVTSLGKAALMEAAATTAAASKAVDAATGTVTTVQPAA